MTRASLSMDNSAFSTDPARVCGVSATGSHVVHTADARREPFFTDQSTEQVRPIAYSNRLRYCRFSRRTSSWYSARSCSSTSQTGRNTSAPPASTYNLV
ncbi:hypothetical protein F0Q45_26155 [Mycobacterium simiae]|uniref:Uncharacterized protein n=1 Tax=Mycobacterium simiae TaxID=1784 RepID=A0A5B1B491_MYCSI|nr:hypothetical protein F0Q45_26155 [Mycobacterium simiae]